jgi:hypothetical protein
MWKKVGEHLFLGIIPAISWQEPDGEFGVIRA